MDKEPHRNREYGFNQISLLREKELGCGSYGKVYKVQCDDVVCAAKVFHETLVQFAPRAGKSCEPLRSPMYRFNQECELLNKVRHPNIVQYLGIYKDDGVSKLPILLMELMNENLTSFLLRFNRKLPYHVQVSICHDISLALSFLHANQIHHRDLSGNNILMYANHRAKVADFGMAKLRNENPQATELLSQTSCPGTKVYMPPEAFNEHPRYTEKLDCFSFGVVVVQVLTGEFPHPGDQRRIVGNAQQCMYELVPEFERREKQINEIDLANPLRSIALKCIQDKDSDRPYAHEVCKQIAQLKEEQRYKDDLEAIPYIAISQDEAFAQMQERKERTERRNQELQQRLQQAYQRFEVQAGDFIRNQFLPRIKLWYLFIGMLIIAIVFAGGNTSDLGSPITSPIDIPLSISGNWRNESLYRQRLWGSYRSNIYFGIRPRIPKSLLFGMMWFVYDGPCGKYKIHHVCEHDDVKKYEWKRHDGTSFGQQIIITPNITIETDFITTSAGWIAKISGNNRTRLSQAMVSFIFYLYNEGDGEIQFNPSNGSISGYTSEFKPFELSFSRTSKGALYLNHLSTQKSKVSRLAEYMQSVMRPGQHGLLQLPGDFVESEEPNLIALQITTKLPCVIDIEFAEGQQHKKVLGSAIDIILSQKEKDFDAKFESVFKLNQKAEFTRKEVDFAKSTFSNLIGSIAYFYGSSKINPKNGSKPVENWPAPLYTAIPSRPFFPRGFLWDEGFHQLVILQWDTSIVKDVIAHWLDLMNADGWIAREQVLGDEARTKVPKEYLVQDDEIANPPTFFLTLEALISHMKDKNVMDLAFLKSIYPRLKLWLKWFNDTQSGTFSSTYRWRGRDEVTDKELNPKTSASGFDDYPRASHPTSDEYHVDLHCWMTYASKVIKDIGVRLGYLSEEHGRINNDPSDQKQLNKWHWDSHRKVYSDFGYHTSKVKLVPKNEMTSKVQRRIVIGVPTKRFVNSFGYVNLFPFLLKLLPSNSVQLEYILMSLTDENLLWTKFGLRSLSKSDPFYKKYNTDHDPPYWRGSIWINMNYLACQALHHYAKSDGKIGHLALNIYDELRDNLITNVYKEYRRTGYVWERYSDETGKGMGTHPHTGWSSLIVLIMAEKY